MVGLANCNQLNKIPLPRPVSFLLELVRWTQVLIDGHMNCFMRFMPLRHRSFQLMLLILSLYMVHAHYNELDAIYAFNFLKLTASVERTDGGVA